MLDGPTSTAMRVFENPRGEMITKPRSPSSNLVVAGIRLLWLEAAAGKGFLGTARHQHQWGIFHDVVVEGRDLTNHQESCTSSSRGEQNDPCDLQPEVGNRSPCLANHNGAATPLGRVCPALEDMRTAVVICNPLQLSPIGWQKTVTVLKNILWNGSLFLASSPSNYSKPTTHQQNTPSSLLIDANYWPLKDQMTIYWLILYLLV